MRLSQCSSIKKDGSLFSSKKTSCCSIELILYSTVFEVPTIDQILM